MSISAQHLPLPSSHSLSIENEAQLDQNLEISEQEELETITEISIATSLTLSMTTLQVNFMEWETGK